MIIDAWGGSWGSSPDAWGTSWIYSIVTPVADFVGVPTSGDAPLIVSFSDLSAGNPDAWTWDFGDGHTSTQQNPTHTYTVAGVYTVSLTVTNSAGSDNKTDPSYITVTQAAVVTAGSTGAGGGGGKGGGRKKEKSYAAPGRQKWIHPEDPQYERKVQEQLEKAAIAEAKERAEVKRKRHMAALVAMDVY